MTADAFLFWFLAFVTVVSGLSVILMVNPIYSALSLAMTMIGVAAIFVTLNAYFLAGVQLIVYAGAVMVLFVMVLMLFDLKHEIQAFTRGRLTGAIKIASVGILSGLIVGAVTMGLKTPVVITASSDVAAAPTVDTTRALAENLFIKNVLGFEVLGVMLLVIAVGAVALSRSKGGTHARD
ncbi:MAG: NADH dehydrogenase [Bdellovibrionales bacterium RIFCSPHIGHO2_01_FULL_40_29]|nr:MAG: NADH dehydrogenase [Bdellovibrionales bacterium RIFCSPHIGHO2_01_FULL_40_29]OFZ34700.1 MAG: NADH dehydrogenase [Bdellovibrionales bacterium RIFCSPHIGHO2_02_FULL_40_15]